MIEIQNATIAHGKNILFKNLNLKLEENKIIGIVAPSGSGKTTLINCITGLKKTQAGTILIDENIINSPKIYHKLSVMPQENGLYYYLNGYDNYKFFASLKRIKLTSKEIYAAFAEYGLQGFEKTLISNYSGGMKRKLSLMITLLGSSKYLFFDEPTVGIDPVYKRTIWDNFERLRDLGKTLFITTHIMEEASRCDEIILLGHNQILKQGTLTNILQEEAVNSLEEVVLKLTGEK